MNRDLKLTRHHIIPRSRGGHNINNVSNVPRREHNLYHQLFENLTPIEVVKYLNREFWNDKYTGIEKISCDQR